MPVGPLYFFFSIPEFMGTPWTAAHQAPPSMGFSRQEDWSGEPLPSPNHRAVWLYYWALRIDTLLFILIFSYIFNALQIFFELKKLGFSPLSVIFPLFLLPPYWLMSSLFFLVGKLLSFNPKVVLSWCKAVMHHQRAKTYWYVGYEWMSCIHCDVFFWPHWDVLQTA